MSFLEFDLEVVRPVRREGVSLCVAENIRVVVIFRRNDGEVYVVWGERRWPKRPGGKGGVERSQAFCMRGRKLVLQ